MKNSKHLYFHLSRRKFIKCAASGAVIAGAPPILAGLTRVRQAEARDDTLRLLITAPTIIPGDWTIFEKETGFKLEYTIIKDVPAIFVTEVMVNDAGDRFDIMCAPSGVEKALIDGEAIAQIDTSLISNWGGMTDGLKEAPLLARDLKPESGRVWGVPLIMNADSFGYFPEKLNEPRPPEEVSWSLVFDSEKTKGKSSIGDNYLYLQEAVAYLATTGQLDVKDIGNPSPEEAEAAADFLIERKKAGQFRNFWSSFDDQLADVVNGEVLALSCWEPVVKEAQRAGLDFEYANGKEFLLKWMQACYIPTQVADRGNLEQVNKALNWILSGSYSAGITPLRGYVSARPDLGMEYAAEHNLGDSVTQAISVAQDKINFKFNKEHYWLNSVTDHVEEMQAQMGRVLNA